MTTRRAAVLTGAGVLLLFLRHPLELRLLRHHAGPRPDPRGDPVQTEETRAPFEHAAGRSRYRIVPRFRWDQSARDNRVVAGMTWTLAAWETIVPRSSERSFVLQKKKREPWLYEILPA